MSNKDDQNGSLEQKVNTSSCGVIPKLGALQPSEGSRVDHWVPRRCAATVVHARSLDPLVKARVFGMTHGNVESEIYPEA